MEGSSRFLMLPWKISVQPVLVLFLDPLFQADRQEFPEAPVGQGRSLGTVGDVEEPLADGRHPDFAAQGLDLPHRVFVGELVGPGVDFPHHPHNGLAAVEAQGDVVEGAPGLLEGPGQVAPGPQGIEDLDEIVAVDLVGLAGDGLIGPGLPELLFQEIDGHHAVPGHPGEVAAHHPHFLVHVFVLIRGVDRHLGIPQVIQHHAVEAVVLAEAAGAVGRGHEEGAGVRVEVRALQQFGQIAGGEDEGVALLAAR